MDMAHNTMPINNKHTQVNICSIIVMAMVNFSISQAIYSKANLSKTVKMVKASLFSTIKQYSKENGEIIK